MLALTITNLNLDKEFIYMGLKMFDLPPDGMQDGAVTLDKEQSTSTEVKPQIITEQVSPDDPIEKS